MKINIRTIASECKVSPATVSKVINERKYVKAETREKVLKAINKLKYDPYKNIAAVKGLKNRLIGFVSPMTANSIDIFGNNAIAVAEQLIRSQGYNCVLFTDSDIADKLKSEFHKGRSSVYCDGFIFFCPFVWEESLKILKGWDIPSVLVRRQTKVKGIPVVADDDFKGAQLAMDHLYRLGHRVIGFCGTNPEKGNAMLERKRGYMEFLQEQGLSVNQDIILTDTIAATFHKTEARLKELMHSPNRPTAFLCEDDGYAINLVNLLKRNGFQVPQDTAVVGYDNSYLGEHFFPALTSVNVPVKEMLGWACDILLDSLKGDPKGTANITLENDLVVRESCGYQLKDDNRNPKTEDR